MSYAATFSDWTLAVLPRLFLYPGGLFLILLVLGLRFLVGGKQGIRPETLLHDLSEFNLPSLAVGWATFALLPMPGAQPLPFPIDRFVLAGLLALSLLLDQSSGEKKQGRPGIEVAILVAVVSPLAGQPSLMLTGNGISGWLSLLAVGLGLAALMRPAGRSLEIAVRWVGWLGLAAVPIVTNYELRITSYELQLGGTLRGVITYIALIVVLGVAGRVMSKISEQRFMVVVWVLAALSLLAALLA